MKRLFAVFVAFGFLTPLFGQEGTNASNSSRVLFKVNAGTTFTIVPDFHNRVFIAERMVVAGVIELRNALRLSIVEGHSTVRPLPGWFVEAEVGYKLPRNYAITFSAGLKRMRFDYETTFSKTDYSPLTDFSRLPQPINPDSYYSKFGYTSLLYVTITPFNISKGFLKNRLVIQAGATIGMLVQHEMNNIVALYFDSSPPTPIEPVPRASLTFFDTVNNLNDWIAGVNVGAEYKIINHLRAKLSTQYYANSLYTETGLEKHPVEKITSWVIQGGLMFEL